MLKIPDMLYCAYPQPIRLAVLDTLSVSPTSRMYINHVILGFRDFPCIRHLIVMLHRHKTKACEVALALKLNTAFAHRMLTVWIAPLNIPPTNLIRRNSVETCDLVNWATAFRLVLPATQIWTQTATWLLHVRTVASRSLDYCHHSLVGSPEPDTGRSGSSRTRRPPHIPSARIIRLSRGLIAVFARRNLSTLDYPARFEWNGSNCDLVNIKRCDRHIVVQY